MFLRKFLYEILSLKGMSLFSATVGYNGCLGFCSRIGEDEDGSSNCELRSCTQ